MKKSFLIGFAVLISGSAFSQITVTVNPSATRQTIRGMGSQADLETKGTNDDLLYDLGASSFRVFAGENSDYYHWDEPVNDNGDVNTVDLSKFIFLPNSDAATRTHRINELKKAAQRGCMFYMTIGSPPCWMKDTSLLMYWMTHPGAPKDKCDAGGKLKAALYDEFGEFALGVAQKFKQEVGVDLYAITVNNEPEFTEPYYSCVYTKDEMVAASKAIAQKFKDNAMTTRIHYAEQTFVQGNVISWAQAANNDALLKDYICAFSIHAYGGVDPFGGGVGTVNDWASYYKESQRVSPVKEVWMTEGGNGDGTTMIDFAISTAGAFYNAMEYGNATLYSCRDLGKGTRWLMYYGFKNFMRYIRPGSIRLASSCSDTTMVRALIFKNDILGANVIYIFNGSKSDKEVKINWSGVTGKFDAIRTASDKTCEWVGQFDLANNVTLPAQSITTFMKVSGNKLPNIDIPDTIVLIKGTAKTINLTGINDGGEGGQTLVVRAKNYEAGAAIFSNIAVNYTSPSTTGSITITPISGLVGTSRLIISVSDKSKTLDSMYNEKTISVPLYVLPYINKAPTMNDVADLAYTKAQINATQLVTLTNVTDGNDGKQKLTLSAVSSAPWIATVTTQGSTLVKITPKAEGTVTITLTLTDDGINAGGGAGTITKTFTVVVGSGINGIEESKNELLIYPVPAHDQINVDNKDMKIQSWQIADITGKIVLSGKALDEKVEINTAGLMPGVYLIRMITADGSVTKKILIE